MSSFYRMGMAIVVGFLFLMGTGIAGAEFPEKPIQILVGYPVGNVNDGIDRVIAQSMQKILKKQVLVQNVPGAGGALVLNRVKTEKPDGYTLFQTGSNLFSQTPHMREVPFDPIKDFAYLGSQARFQQVINDRPDNPWKNFDEMIQYVKKHPMKVRYSSTGVGGGLHMAMLFIGLRDNLQWVHVPYNGSTEALTALLGGHVELAAVSFGLEAEYVKAGRVRPLLGLNHKRVSLFPDLPTMWDKGYGFANVASTCWAVSANTPKDIQKILEDALVKSFNDPEVIDIVNKWSMANDPIGADATTKMIAEDNVNFGSLAKKAGIGIYKK